MTKKTKNYAIIMVIGVILNLGLYNIAHVFHLPLWMDSVGTAFAAVALEPAAGLIVAFTTNFYESLVIYDVSSLVYYAVSAMAALTFGIMLRKEGKIKWSRLPQTMLVYAALCGFLSMLLTLWRTGIPDSGWERRIFDVVISYGGPVPLGCFVGATALKVMDSIVMAILLPLLCRIFRPMLESKNEVVVSWSTPFFTKKASRQPAGSSDEAGE